MTSCACLWCGSPFELRVTGGKRQRFCSERCRRAFGAAAREYGCHAVETGIVTVAELKECLSRNARVALASKTAFDLPQGG
jgi:hypothetical protein